MDNITLAICRLLYLDQLQETKTQLYQSLGLGIEKNDLYTLYPEAASQAQRIQGDKRNQLAKVGARHRLCRETGEMVRI